MLVLDFDIVIFCIYKQTFLIMSLLPMFRSSHQLKKIMLSLIVCFDMLF